MMFRRERSNKGFLMGTFLGTIAGGIAALLLAPKSGKETRRELSKKYRATCDTTKEMFDQVGEEAEDLVERARDLAENAKEVYSWFGKKRR